MSEPTAHLVLTVPPAIAAAWERLAPEAQTYWSRLIVHGWLRYILDQGPPHVLHHGPPQIVPDIFAMSVAELSTFVRQLERKFGVHAGEEPPHAS